MRFNTALFAVALSAGAVQSGFAADLPVKAAPTPVAVVAQNWSGIYVGGHLGYGWADHHLATNAYEGLCASPACGGTGNESIHLKSDGMVGGLQIGARWQAGNWVFGVEGTVSKTDIHDSGPVFNSVTGIGVDGSVVRSKIESLYTITGQIGYSWDRWLAYVKGGAAMGNVRLRADVCRPEDAPACLGPNAGTTLRPTGWTAGGGVEYAFVRSNMFTASFAVEYDFVRLNEKSGAARASDGFQANFALGDTDIHQLLAKVNITGPWPR